MQFANQTNIIRLRIILLDSMIGLLKKYGQYFEGFYIKSEMKASVTI